ncbi:MAG: SPASM domain-containing protein, partial [Candidatus Tectomicrobia bacterium]|nr:SPASM domain-containing protein [Candidatus Tectomicrobia bacterium]
GIHLDTVHQETYNQLHRDPKGLQQKIRGFKNLLEAGFAPSRIFGCICLTRPAVERIEETLDWFVEEMGVRFIDMPTFRPLGYGKDQARLKAWEPSAEEVQRACEYRAKKLGPSLLRFGPMECSKFFCQSYFLITSEGNVLCCGNIPDLVFGNVFQEGFREIFERNRDRLLFSFEIKGKCGSCENNDVCFGCRANAFYYAGDIQASDPKCWMNEGTTGGPLR